MPFGMVSRVGRGMGVLDGRGNRRRGKGSFVVNLGRPIVTNGAFATRSSQITLSTCYFIIISASLSIRIANRALMLLNIRLSHLSVRTCEQWQVATRLIGSGCRLGCCRD